MKKWLATLIDDLKFLGSEVKKECTNLEVTPAANATDTAKPHMPVYIPFDSKCAGTNVKFYRH
ncbi:MULTISPECIES: hypothetical protein [Citrobacter]|uniref:hypothetical protein n=1 Tax=Citrobacter TaxID=544 RepID=UPI00109D677F|nr:MULTISPECIES: hypothetical protein [Citrobacter]EBS1368551.1 hypothetical protein [Salmonella enterica subsp. enterica serovar Virchow]HBB6718607.1 hypothetical protein [Serratia marcescens]MBM3011238.1 hypothetical protein [Citrobacter freundii]MBY1059840.1 hypothetical protein [Citrobacter europaeus]MDE9616131.1 hypothetical protein [Citrobacter portucalensis]